MDITGLQSTLTTTVNQQQVSDKAQVTQPQAQSLQTKQAAPELKEMPVQEAVDKANTIISSFNTHLQFVLDERLNNQLVVKIVDNESGEVVRQYPPEEMLNVMAKLEDTILGVLVDNKA